MPINVCLRTESGHVVSVPGNAFLESQDVPEVTDQSFPYLRLLDPYGDTVFSRWQMVAVLPELERLALAHPSERMDAILGLARICARDIHTYLVFKGD